MKNMTIDIGHEINKQQKSQKRPHTLKYAFFLLLAIIAAIVVSYIYMDSMQQSNLYVGPNVDDSSSPPPLPGQGTTLAESGLPSVPDFLRESGSEDLPAIPGFP
jgi:hypothetical protein